DDDAKLAPPVRGSSTRDRSKTVYVRDGDIFLYDFSTDKVTQLTKTAEAESDTHFTQDEQHVAFTRSNNLYALALAGGMIEQLTEIGSGREEPKPADPKTSQGVLQIQEKDLLGAVGDRVRRREADEAERKREHPRKPFKLEARQVVRHLELCPNGKCVIAMIEDGANGDKRD